MDGNPRQADRPLRYECAEYENGGTIHSQDGSRREQ